MNFNEHSNLKGLHAFIGASKYHWIHYDDDKFLDVYDNIQAVQKGVELHDFAAKCIKLKQTLPKSKKTLNMYVNDAIGYRMTPEQILLYSENCFGTADAISFWYDKKLKKNVLRIHDLKTGSSPAHIEQLYIYTALFCLEYEIKPKDILIELRIYQSNEVFVDRPELDDILPIMDKIIHFDELIKERKMSALA